MVSITWGNKYNQPTDIRSPLDPPRSPGHPKTSNGKKLPETLDFDLDLFRRLARRPARSRWVREGELPERLRLL